MRGAFFPYFEAGQNRVASAEAKSPASHNENKRAGVFAKIGCEAEKKKEKKKAIVFAKTWCEAEKRKIRKKKDKLSMNYVEKLL